MQQYQEADCKTIKYEIAKLDREIIFRLVQRLQYETLANKIELNNNNYDAVEDFKLMLEQRKLWAISAGLSPDTVYKLSEYLIAYYLTE